MALTVHRRMMEDAMFRSDRFAADLSALPMDVLMARGRSARAHQASSLVSALVAFAKSRLKTVSGSVSTRQGGALAS